MNLPSLEELRRRGATISKSAAEVIAEEARLRNHSTIIVVPDGLPLKHPKFQQRREGDRGMNKTEEAMSRELESLKDDGKITRWRFESVKIRLADRTWFTVDFQLWIPDGRIVMLETKGWLRDDAAVKFKVAREMYPEYIWVMYRRDHGRWNRIYGNPIDVLSVME